MDSGFAAEGTKEKDFVVEGNFTGRIGVSSVLDCQMAEEIELDMAGGRPFVKLAGSRLRRVRSSSVATSCLVKASSNSENIGFKIRTGTRTDFSKDSLASKGIVVREFDVNAVAVIRRGS